MSPHAATPARLILPLKPSALNPPRPSAGAHWQALLHAQASRRQARAFCGCCSSEGNECASCGIMPHSSASTATRARDETTRESSESNAGIGPNQKRSGLARMKWVKRRPRDASCRRAARKQRSIRPNCSRGAFAAVRPLASTRISSPGNEDHSSFASDAAGRPPALSAQQKKVCTLLEPSRSGRFTFSFQRLTNPAVSAAERIAEPRELSTPEITSATAGLERERCGPRCGSAGGEGLASHCVRHSGGCGHSADIGAIVMMTW